MNPRISQHEVETICLLLAVEDGACSSESLAERLGLGSALVQPLAACIEPLVRDGRLGSTAGAVCLSDRGRAWLRERLRDLGLA